MHLDMHGMRTHRTRDDGPTPDNVPKPFVGGNLPLDRNPLVRHAPKAVIGNGVERKPSPQDNGVAPGIPRSDAKSEGIGGERLVPTPRPSGPSG
jgi:hypothetical protein